MPLLRVGPHRRRRPAASRRPLAWLLAVPIALVLLPTAFDARAPIAGAVLLLGPVLSLLGFHLPGYGRSDITDWMLLSHAVSAAILLIVGASIARRRLRL
jgi:hypothetical protein